MGDWTGTVQHRDCATEVRITLGAKFPFRPPRVLPVDQDAVPWSWHRELDGALCLVAENDRNDLWWMNTQVFLDHIAAWFDASVDGWSNDTADLHLDRYFYAAADERLYLYHHLDDYRDATVRFVPKRHPHLPHAPERMELKDKRDKPARKGKYGRRDIYGHVAHLGEITVPLRSWGDFGTYLDPVVERSIRLGRIDILVLTYTRADVEAVVLLEVIKDSTGGIVLRRLRSASDTPAARAARSGPNVDALQNRRVAVVGIGALGSFVADTLLRAGIGRLTLADDDILLPGNLIRHVAGAEYIGMVKPDAVKEHLVRTHAIDPDRIVTRGAIDESNGALSLLETHDLVINCTADFSTTALLAASARCAGTNMISVAMQNDGSTFRIDLIPPLNGADPLPDSARPPTTPAGIYREAGCGDPISPTPPQAVIEAAAATTRHAVALLINRTLQPAGESRDLDPGLR